MRHTIAVCDYHDHDISLYQAVLGKYNFDVRCLEVTNALQQLQANVPDVLIDGTMTGIYVKEWKFIESLREDPSTRLLPVIIATTNAEAVRGSAEFERHQPIYVLPKPFSMPQLVETVQRALEAVCRQKPMLN